MKKIELLELRKSGGVLCLPMVQNIPDAGKRHLDWKIAQFCTLCALMGGK